MSSRVAERQRDEADAKKNAIEVEAHRLKSDAKKMREGIKETNARVWIHCCSLFEADGW